MLLRQYIPCGRDLVPRADVKVRSLQNSSLVKSNLTARIGYINVLFGLPQIAYIHGNLVQFPACNVALFTSYIGCDKLHIKVIFALYLNSYINLPWNYSPSLTPLIRGAYQVRYHRIDGSSEKSGAIVTPDFHAKIGHILRLIYIFFQTYYNQSWGLF